MKVIEIEPQAALEEVAETQRKLADALVRLGRTRDADVKIGTTPKEEVLRIDKTVLYRYVPMVEKPSPVPILLTYALVGRYTMMDLQEDRSFVRNLLRAGLDVYLVDWGHPSRADRFAGLDDYVNDYIAACVDEMRRRHGVDAVNLLGVCQGGVLSLCYTALHPEPHPQPDHDGDTGRLPCRQGRGPDRPRLHERLGAQPAAGGHRPAGRHAGHRAGRVRGLPVLAHDPWPQPHQVQPRSPGRRRRRGEAAQLPAHGALARRPSRASRASSRASG